MDWITPTAAIGAIHDVESAIRRPVTGILSLVPLPSGIVVPEDIDHLVVPLIDGAGNLEPQVRRAVGFATDFLRDQEPLFVHCHAGRSRSVVILAMALMRHQGLSKAEALATISRRREIALTPGIEAMFRWVD